VEVPHIAVEETVLQTAADQAVAEGTAHNATGAIIKFSIKN
jgi:hypothetical protein